MSYLSPQKNDIINSRVSANRAMNGFWWQPLPGDARMMYKKASDKTLEEMYDTARNPIKASANNIKFADMREINKIVDENRNSPIVSVDRIELKSQGIDPEAVDNVPASVIADWQRPSSLSSFSPPSKENASEAKNMLLMTKT